MNGEGAEGRSSDSLESFHRSTDVEQMGVRVNTRLRIGYAILASLVIVTFALSATYSARPISYYFDPHGTQLMLICWLLPLPVWVMLLALRLARRGANHPSRTIFRMAKLHRHWLMRGLALTALALPLGRAFSAFKASIPRHTVYWADPVLANFERNLLSEDAWRFTHSLIGPVGTIWVDRAYLLWFFGLMLTIGWLNLTKDRRFQLRGLISYISIWVGLGMIGALAFASAGPCFYDHFHGGTRFAPLMTSLEEAHRIAPLTAIHEMRWLLFKYETIEFGSGISAMPSMHVAVAWLIVLLCHFRFGLKWPTWIAAIFAGMVLFGSVHLGWHYVSDGLISIIATSLIWRTTKFVNKPIVPSRIRSLPGK